MKTRLWMLAIALTLAASLKMQAASVMRLSGDGGANWIIVTDNGPLDVNGMAGFITYNGPVDGWQVNVASAIGQPLAGTTNRPTMDVQTFNYSEGSADLIVQMSETGFISQPVAQTYFARIIGNTAGTVVFETWRDNGDVLFGTTESYSGDAPGISPSPTASQLTSQGPFSGGAFLDSASATVPPQPNSTYSVTLQTTVTHTTAGNTRTDALFFSPIVFTRCPNDIDLGCNPPTIPDCDPTQVAVESSDPASVVITCTSSTTTNGCFRARTITYTATDSSGTSVTCTHRVFWKEDLTAPVISPLTNQTYQCNQPWNFDVPTATDNCDQPLLAIDSTSTNVVPCGYTATQIWKATDLCGNSSYATQVVAVADTIAPLINCSPNKSVDCSAPWTFDAPTATDNCGTATVTILNTVTNPANCGFTATRIWAATDGCGNSVQCTQTVAVVDTTLPTITCANDKFVECNTLWSFDTPSASDNCGTPNVTIVSTVTNGTACNMEITRTWRATDSCGNSSVCSQKITIRDTTPPTITCLPDTTTNCVPLPYCSYTPGGWGAPPNGQNPGMLLKDNFGTVFPTGVEIGIPGAGGYSLKFTSASAIELFLPNGGTPGPLTADAINPASSISGSFGQHVLALTLNVSFSAAGITGGANGPLGSLVLNDPSSPFHGKTISQILAIANTLLGGGSVSGVSISTAHGIIGSINEGFDNCRPNGWAMSKFPVTSCSVSTNSSTPTVSDNCDPHPLLTFKDSSVSNACGSTVIRTWYVVDSCGNSNSCTQQITSQDLPPTINCSANKTVECGTAWSFNPPTVSNGTIVIVSTVTNGSGCDLSVTRTWRATNACGVSAPCSQTVFVRDTTPPVINCAPNTTNCIPQAYCSYTPGGWGAPPNGQNPGMLLKNNFGTVFPTGVEIGISGAGGYSLKFTSAAAIELFLPNGGTPGPLTADAVNPASSISGSFGQHVLALTLNVSFSAAGITGGSNGPLGSLVYTEAGSPLNGKTISQILAIANTLLGGGSVSGVTIGSLHSVISSLNEGFDNCTTTAWAKSKFNTSTCTVTPTTPTASDNCDPHPLITFQDSTVSTGCSIVVIRTWYATDACGNSNSCVQQLTKTDNECVGSSFNFTPATGSATDGTDGNVRTFTVNGVSVKATAFSRVKLTGAWSTAWLGQYSGGLGVTDPSEGNGNNNRHSVDNIDRDNYILFEFSQAVVLQNATLGYVVTDSDLKVWIGTFNNPYANHLNLNDAVLASFGYSEDNLTGLSTARTAALNAGAVAGNAIVIAARPGDSTLNDQFKIQLLGICVPQCTPPPPCTGSICGTVLRDCDADGYLTGESGLAGWTVTLKSGTTTVSTKITDATGNYCFNGLSAGNYDVVVTPAASHSQTYDLDGTKDNKYSVALTACQNKTGVNFGYTGTSASVKIVATGPANANCGDTITYTFAVTNTGNTCVYGGLTVNSTLLGGQIFHQTPVNPGQGFVFTKTYVVKSTDVGSLVMTATAVGDPPGSLANVTHTASVTTTVSCNGTLPPPVCLTATPASSNKVTLKWSPYSGASSYKVKRSYVKGGPYAVIKTGLTTTNYTDLAVTNGAVYYYVVSAIKSGSETPDSNEDSAFPSAGGPKGWYTKDIGAVGDVGGSSYIAPKLWVGGSGADIWGTADEFRYTYLTASGDCSIVARVTGIQNTDPWAKAGLMIRKTLADNAEHASVFLTPGNGVAFQSRATAGGVSVNTNVTGPVAPYWLKLVRTGNVFTASYSANGSTWTTLGSTTISMTTGVYIGFAVTSHNDGIISVATFDNMTVTP